MANIVPSKRAIRHSCKKRAHYYMSYHLQSNHLHVHARTHARSHAERGREREGLNKLCWLYLIDMEWPAFCFVYKIAPTWCPGYIVRIRIFGGFFNLMCGICTCSMAHCAKSEPMI